MERDNQPIFNVKNRNILHFKDFDADVEKEKEELKDVKRSFAKNALDTGPIEHKFKYNKVTHKYDDLVKPEVDDKIKSIEELEGEKTEENVGNKIKTFNELSKINEYYPAAKLGKKGKERIKKMLYKEVDRYINGLSESSDDNGSEFFIRNFKIFLKEQLGGD